MTAIYDFLAEPPERGAGSSPFPATFTPATQHASPGQASGAQSAARGSHADPLGFDQGLGDYRGPSPVTAVSHPPRNNPASAPVPPGVARATPRPSRVAIVVDRLGSYQARVIEGVGSGLRRHGVDLMVYASRRADDPDGTVLGHMLRDAGLSGVVSMVYPLFGAAGAIDDVIRRVGDIPTVVVGTQLPHISTVACDNAASMAILMAHLLDEGGVRHPAFVRGGVAAGDSKERERAFRLACNERGIPVDESRVTSGQFGRAAAYRTATQLLRADEAIDGIVAANDDIAEGVLDALADVGIDVPGRVKVTGFDGDARSARTRPPLTTIDQRLYEQGEAAADLLAAQLDGDRQARSVRIEGRLIVRRSTRPYRVLPTRRVPRDAVNSSRDALFGVVQAEIGPCPPVVDGTWARRWLERLRDQMETGVLDESWTRSWGRPTGTVDDLERATTWLTSASRVVLDVLWQSFRSDDSRFAAADLHGQVVARLAIVRADGTRSSDRADLVALRNVVALNHSLSVEETLSGLTRTLTEHLPDLGVTHLYVVLFEPAADGGAHALRTGAESTGAQVATGKPGAAGESRIVLAYVDGAVQADDVTAGYRLSQLFGDDEDAPALTVTPLSTHGRQYGLLLHRQVEGYGAISDAVHLDLVAWLDTIVERHRLVEQGAGLQSELQAKAAQLSAEIDNRLKVEEELRRANRELTRSLLVDSLTGIHNRASLDEVLEREFEAHARSRRPLAFLMIDVDHFKSYNDRYGHVQGDATLREVASRLRNAARRGGDVAARYGGEEFALVLPDTDQRGAERVASELLSDVRSLGIDHTEAPLGSITVSIGVSAVVPSGEWVVADLVRAADAALYQAKAAGRDRMVAAEPRPQPADIAGATID